MLVVLYSPIPHGVAPQQSSTMLQTAVAKVLTLVQKAKKTAEKVILQNELYAKNLFSDCHIDEQRHITEKFTNHFVTKKFILVTE